MEENKILLNFSDSDETSWLRFHLSCLHDILSSLVSKIGMLMTENISCKKHIWSAFSKISSFLLASFGYQNDINHHLFRAIVSFRELEGEPCLSKQVKAFNPPIDIPAFLQERDLFPLSYSVNSDELASLIDELFRNLDRMLKLVEQLSSNRDEADTGIQRVAQEFHQIVELLTGQIWPQARHLCVQLLAFYRTTDNSCTEILKDLQFHWKDLNRDLTKIIIVILQRS